MYELDAIGAYDVSNSDLPRPPEGYAGPDIVSLLEDSGEGKVAIVMAHADGEWVGSDVNLRYYEKDGSPRLALSINDYTVGVPTTMAIDFLQQAIKRGSFHLICVFRNIPDDYFRETGVARPPEGEGYVVQGDVPMNPDKRDSYKQLLEALETGQPRGQGGGSAGKGEGEADD
jgi:hypothetical protein